MENINEKMEKIYTDYTTATSNLFSFLLALCAQNVQLLEKTEELKKKKQKLKDAIAAIEHTVNGDAATKKTK